MCSVLALQEACLLQTNANLPPRLRFGHVLASDSSLFQELAYFSAVISPDSDNAASSSRAERKLFSVPVALPFTIWSADAFMVSSKNVFFFCFPNLPLLGRCRDVSCCTGDYHGIVTCQSLWFCCLLLWLQFIWLKMKYRLLNIDAPTLFNRQRDSKPDPPSYRPHERYRFHYHLHNRCQHPPFWVDNRSHPSPRKSLTQTPWDQTIHAISILESWQCASNHAR